MTTAIILAGGKSTRMGGGLDKAFLSLCGKPVVAWSLLAFERASEIGRIVLVVRKDQLSAAKAVVKMFGISKIDKIVAGGARRQDSVLEGLKGCDIDTRNVLIHDAARPCVTSELINELCKLVKRMPAVVPGREVTDTLKRCEKGKEVSETVPRNKLWSVQTPQAFQMKVLRDAYKALPAGQEFTDDASVVEMSGGTVRIMETEFVNMKITFPDDLRLVSAYLK